MKFSQTFANSERSLLLQIVSKMYNRTIVEFEFARYQELENPVLSVEATQTMHSFDNL